jgi:hypothetical protein
VAVGKFLISQTEEASNVTITAVDAQFIPYFENVLGGWGLHYYYRLEA